MGTMNPSPSSRLWGTRGIQFISAAALFLAPGWGHAAAPGVWVGESETAPTITGGRLVLAPDDTGETLTYSARLQASSSTVALLVPHPAPDEAYARLANPDALRILDSYTAPRVDRVTCDDLVSRTYLYTAPGCRTHEKPDLTVPELRDASEVLSELKPRAAIHADVTVVRSAKEGDAPLLTDWLTQEGLQAPTTWPESMQAHFDEGGDVLAVLLSFEDPLSQEWTPPLRFHQPHHTDGMDLPLAGSGPPEFQDVIIYTVNPEQMGRPEIGNYPVAALPDGCMPSPQAPPGWYEGYLDERLAEAGLPSWALEFTGPADTCDPCTELPLSDATLLELGSTVGASEAWLSRIHMRSPADLLNRSPTLSYVPAPTAIDTTFIAYQRALEFAFPICNVGWVEAPGSCPDFDAASSPACAPTGSAPYHAALFLTCGLVLLRRKARTRTLVSMSLIGILWSGGDAEARPTSRPVPRAEVVFGPTLLTTPRLSTDTASLKVVSGKRWRMDSHVAVWGRSKTSLELTVGIQSTRARLGQSQTLFSILEPDFGVAVRHGRFEGHLSPFLRLGTRWATSIVDTSVWTPHSSQSLLVHTDAGVWVGRNGRRWSTMVRLSVVPRTDAWEVQFHPMTGMEGWTFLPGYVGASLLFGLAFP